MESLGKFTAALMAASQENTMAPAALNFDFSLYKVEAPKEYQLLGTSLSEDRRRQAEGGSQHIAARKLGAIFRSRLPKVPHLLQAFGHRVSEIAAASKKMNKTTSSYSAESHENHIFSNNVGIDGTSLWAAATSGPEALCVQLLACILARIWSAPQAISIWAEILDVRKAELHQEGMQVDMPDIAALNFTVTREQVAELDASTRSWLQTADILKATERTQLCLIIGDIVAPVNNTPGTYDSVMEAWTVSMQVADNLIAGVAQSVHNGGALLGLSAWHLYPDMSVYSSGLSSGPPGKEARQGDPLINPGGILTVGLRPSDDFSYGVRWSLPLAELRYYGPPTRITRTIGADPSRISITELMLAALGALSREWPERKDKYDHVCNFYQLLASRLVVSTDWVVVGYKALGKAAEEFLNAPSDRRQIMMRIMAYGSRNGGEFLKDEQGKAPTLETQTLSLIHNGVLDFQEIPAKSHSISIILLGFIDQLYEDLDTSEPTVSLDVLRSPLSLKKCFSGFRSVSEKTRTATAFATVAYLETGDQDLDPRFLNDVMAVAVGSSIYAAGVLSCDPHEDSDSWSLSRTFGNIGKPGVSLLVPPSDPEIKKNDAGEWNVINHEPWDGTAADHFSKTSLHLSLTEYRLPCTSQNHGQRDMEAFFQEAIVSVYDGNDWVGDIDIVKALSSTSTLAKVPSECENGHMYDIQTMAIERQPQKGKKRSALMNQIVCADSWQELLDKADRPMILRCHENWVGRLAVTSISVQLGYRVLVLPRRSCRNGCFKDPNFTSRSLVGNIDVIIL